MEEADKDWMMIRMVGGECSFWYQLPRVVRDKRAIKRLLLFSSLSTDVSLFAADTNVGVCSDEADVEHQCNNAESGSDSVALPCVSAAAAVASVLHHDWSRCR